METSQLSKETYIKKVLERFQMQTCKPIDTYIEKGSTLSLSMYPQTLEEKEKIARVFYSNVVESLMIVHVYCIIYYYIPAFIL